MPRQGGTRCRLRGSPRLVSAPHRREKRQADGIGGDVRSGDGSFPAARLGSDVGLDVGGGAQDGARGPLMVDGITGSVEAYDPNGWDHAAGHVGYVADSASQALAAFALLARYEERFGDGDATAPAEFTELLEQLGLDPEDEFWQYVVNELREDHLDVD
jgi:hypothetical protein